MIFSFVVKATSISDLDFLVTLIAVLTSCDRPKVERKSLSALPLGSPPIRLQLRSPRLSHEAKTLQALRGDLGL